MDDSSNDFIRFMMLKLKKLEINNADSASLGLVTLWRFCQLKNSNVLTNALAYILFNLMIFHLSPEKIAVAVILQLVVILFSLKTFFGT